MEKAVIQEAARQRRLCVGPQAARRLPPMRSQVIECVGHNDKAKADALMAGDYAKISGDLTATMMKWKAAAQ